MPGAVPLNAQHLKSVQVVNQAALKKTPDQGTAPYTAATLDVAGKAHLVVLIGDKHDRDVSRAVASSAKKFHGTIDVGKGGLMAPGELIVSGAKAQFAPEFKQVLGAFSKKKVTFR